MLGFIWYLVCAAGYMFAGFVALLISDKLRIKYWGDDPNKLYGNEDERRALFCVAWLLWPVPFVFWTVSTPIAKTWLYIFVDLDLESLRASLLNPKKPESVVSERETALEEMVKNMKDEIEKMQGDGKANEDVELRRELASTTLEVREVPIESIE